MVELMIVLFLAATMLVAYFALVLFISGESDRIRKKRKENLLQAKSVPQLMDSESLPRWMIKELILIQSMPENNEAEVCLKAHSQAFWFKLVMEYVDGEKTELDVKRSLQSPL